MRQQNNIMMIGFLRYNYSTTTKFAHREAAMRKKNSPVSSFVLDVLLHIAIAAVPVLFLSYLLSAFLSIVTNLPKMNIFYCAAILLIVNQLLKKLEKK